MDRQIEAGESLSGSDGARNPHRDRERSPAFFFPSGSGSDWSEWASANRSGSETGAEPAGDGERAAKSRSTGRGATGSHAPAEKGSRRQKLPIQAVLEFFGQEAVARVVKESPKLIEPE